MNYPEHLPQEVKDLLLKEPTKADVYREQGKLRGQLDNKTLGSEGFRNSVVSMANGVVGVADTIKVDWANARYVLRFTTRVTTEDKARVILREVVNVINSHIIRTYGNGKTSLLQSWTDSSAQDISKAVAISAVGDPDDHGF